MQQEAALPSQHKRVHDAQHGIDRIRIGGLANPAAPGCRFPLRAKVSALERPPAQAMPHLHFGIAIGNVGRREFDVEDNLCLSRVAHETGIPALQHIEEARVGRIQAHGHAPDFNHEAETLDFSG